MSFPLMVINVCPSRVTDVPDRFRRGWGDVLCHKFRAECERLAAAAALLSLWPPPPSPRPPWWVSPLLHFLNLVGSKRIVAALRWPNVLSPGEVSGEEGGGEVLVGNLPARVCLGQPTSRATSHRSAVDSARLKDESQMWSSSNGECSERVVMGKYTLKRDHTEYRNTQNVEFSSKVSCG